MALNVARLSQSIYDKIVGAGIKDPVGNWKTVADAIASSVVAEVTTYAEVPAPPPVVVPPLTFAQGSGPAAVPNPAPVPLAQQPLPPGSVK